ncbi:MAG: hypothetical protein HUJ61_02405 [Bacilli bacterium]|nr:hypothetical protein [Bacilli bacterium]
MIHLSSIGTNEGAIIPSLNYSKIVINEINSIPEVSRVVFVNKANHSEMRVLGTKRGELAKEDLGLVMEELFKNGLRKDIKFVSDEVINFEFSGKNIAIMHGCQSYCKSREKLMNY